MFYEEWEQWGTYLRQRTCKLTWKLVQWLLHGENAYGEAYAQAISETGYSPDYVRNLLWVGAATLKTREAIRAINPSARDLPFSFYEEVAPREIEEDDKQSLLLAAAERIANQTPGHRFTHRSFAALVEEYKKQRALPEPERDEGATGRLGEGATEPAVELTASDYGKIVAAKLSERAEQADAPSANPSKESIDPDPFTPSEADAPPIENQKSSIGNLLLSSFDRQCADRLIAYFFRNYHTETDEQLFPVLVRIVWEDIFGEQEPPTERPFEEEE